jgi:hypothetical protein
LADEKDARERHLKMYEDEKSLHQTTSIELLRMKSMHQDSDMNFKNSKIEIDNLVAIKH